MIFDKKPTTIEEQLDLFISRGLLIPNKRRAKHYLDKVGYYRLSSYALPFQSKEDPKHKFNTLIRVSTLTNAIRQVVFDKDIDFIVMGTKGATGLKEVFMGSNAYKIIKNINSFIYPT